MADQKTMGHQQGGGLGTMASGPKRPPQTFRGAQGRGPSIPANQILAGAVKKAPPLTPMGATGNATTGGNKPAQPPSTPQPGQGGPFQMQNWYGANPLQTAQDRANRMLSQNLAGIRGRYGAQGMGNSSREAISEGTAAGEAATGLGDVLAQRGLGAYESDANRALAANQQLANMGTGLTGIGSQEQQSPMAQFLLSLISGLSGQDIWQNFAQSGQGGYWK